MGGWDETTYVRRIKIRKREDRRWEIKTEEKKEN